MRRLGEDESGVAAIEFAIVAPVFIVMLLGILVYGLYFTVAQSVQQLAAEAARAAIGGLNDEERAELASDRALAQVAFYPLLDAANIDIEAAADPTDPDLFQVVIVYDASHLGLSAFSAILPSPADQIERSAVIRRGGL